MSQPVLWADVFAISALMVCAIVAAGVIAIVLYARRKYR